MIYTGTKPAPKGRQTSAKPAPYRRQTGVGIRTKAQNKYRIYLKLVIGEDCDHKKLS